MIREKALSGIFEGLGNVDIETAVKELNPSTFCFFAWLCSQDKSLLKKGRKEISKKYGRSYYRTNQLIRELSRKGYVSTHSFGAYDPTLIRIERKISLKFGNGIVKDTKRNA